MHIKFHESLLEDLPRGSMSDFECVLETIVLANPTGEIPLKKIAGIAHTWWRLEGVSAEDCREKENLAFQQWYDRMIDAGWFELDKDDAEVIIVANKADWYENPELPSAVYKAQAEEVLALFNELTQRKVQMVPERERYIIRRIKEGEKMKPATGVNQFRAVFEFKIKEWKGTEYEKYIEIKTLCGGKFYDYLEQARVAFKKNKGTAALPKAKTWYVVADHKEGTVTMTYDQPALEDSNLEQLYKDELIELVHRYAQDYCTANHYLFIPNGTTTKETKLTIGGNSGGKISQPASGATGNNAQDFEAIR